MHPHCQDNVRSFLGSFPFPTVCPAPQLRTVLRRHLRFFCGKFRRAPALPTREPKPLPKKYPPADSALHRDIPAKLPPRNVSRAFGKPAPIRAHFPVRQPVLRALRAAEVETAFPPAWEHPSGRSPPPASENILPDTAVSSRRIRALFVPHFSFIPSIR